jgi:hypothetical protein
MRTTAKRRVVPYARGFQETDGVAEISAFHVQTATRGGQYGGNAEGRHCNEEKGPIVSVLVIVWT